MPNISVRMYNPAYLKAMSIVYIETHCSVEYKLLVVGA